MGKSMTFRLGSVVRMYTGQYTVVGIVADENVKQFSDNSAEEYWDRFSATVNAEMPALILLSGLGTHRCVHGEGDILGNLETLTDGLETIGSLNLHVSSPDEDSSEESTKLVRIGVGSRVYVNGNIRQGRGKVVALYANGQEASELDDYGDERYSPCKVGRGSKQALVRLDDDGKLMHYNEHDINGGMLSALSETGSSNSVYLEVPLWQGDKVADDNLPGEPTKENTDAGDGAQTVGMDDLSDFLKSIIGMFESAAEQGSDDDDDSGCQCPPHYAVSTPGGIFITGKRDTALGFASSLKSFNFAVVEIPGCLAHAITLSVVEQRVQ